MKQTTYKDFFDLTDYFSTDTIDFSYRKNIVNQENIPKETEHSIVSFEKINATNMLGIYKYLKYKLSKIKEENTFENEEIQKQILWFEKNIHFFELKLSQIEQSCTFITPDFAFFCKHFEKISYSKEEKVVGRLYNSTSIQTLPREIRYYLFKDDYVDFAMVNAHPSILFQFCKEHKLKLNGSLEEYVLHRSSVMSEIKNELDSKKPNEISKAHIKTLVLKHLNRTWDLKDNVQSKTLYRLDQDFSVARDHLWSMYNSGALSNEYTLALKHSLKKKNKTGDKDTTALKKISLQSFYCQTKESEYILCFVKYLREKYQEKLVERKIVDHNHYYPTTDKTVDLPAVYSLSVVPFFDGVYVSSPDSIFNRNLEYFVEEYNNSNITNIVFEKKTIERNDSHFTDVSELSNFLIIHRWMSSTSSKKSFNTFISHLHLMNDFFERLALIEKRYGYDQKTEQEEVQWEEDYKKLISTMHHRVYDELLKHNFNNVQEIDLYIKSICSDGHPET